LGRISKYRITRGGKFEDKSFRIIIAVNRGAREKCRHSFSCKKRQWDIENKAHHRLKESKMGRKGLGEDFKVQNNQRRQV
jgi:hypothetical protein